MDLATTTQPTTKRPSPTQRRLDHARECVTKYEALDAEVRQRPTQFAGPDMWASDLAYWRAEAARYEAQLAEVGRG